MSHTTNRSRRAALAVAVGALLIAGTAACNPTTGSSVSTDAKPTTASSGAKSTSGSSGQSSASKAAKVGDTIALKGMDSSADITVVKIVDNPAGADDYTTPDAGKRFVAVQFRIKVTGGKAYSDSPSNGAKLVDSQGQSYDADITSDTKAGTSFPAIENLALGATGLGFITFQVPTGAKITQVQFGLDSGMADQTGQWSVN